MSVSWNDKDAPTPPGSSYGYARVSTTDQDIVRERAQRSPARSDRARARDGQAGTSSNASGVCTHMPLMFTGSPNALLFRLPAPV